MHVYKIVAHIPFTASVEPLTDHDGGLRSDQELVVVVVVVELLLMEGWRCCSVMDQGVSLPGVK